MDQDNGIKINVRPQSWVQAPDGKPIIKVIGVGGGGSNAVDHMMRTNVQGCRLIVCNTDKQHLDSCSTPDKILLGRGGGAGTNPQKARDLAMQSGEELRQRFITEHTDMVFITAGMGGGTGTGASPVIAQMCREAKILTVGVVTIPFRNEGKEIYARAVDGILHLRENVDSLIIVDNEKLYRHYGDEVIQTALPKVDEVLATAVRSVTEIIDRRGMENVDFEDIKNMMSAGGMAIMGIGKGRGENRVKDAVDGALASELLYDFDLTSAKSILVNITVPKSLKLGLKVNELELTSDYIKERTGKSNFFKRGITYNEDPAAEDSDEVIVTIIAIGFKVDCIANIMDIEQDNIIPIDQSFTAASSDRERHETISGDGDIKRVSLTHTINQRRFNFALTGETPDLCNPELQQRQLEREPAIRRKERKNKSYRKTSAN